MPWTVSVGAPFRVLRFLHTTCPFACLNMCPASRHASRSDLARIGVPAPAPGRLVSRAWMRPGSPSGPPPTWCLAVGCAQRAFPADPAASHPFDPSLLSGAACSASWPNNDDPRPWPRWRYCLSLPSRCARLPGLGPRFATHAPPSPPISFAFQGWTRDALVLRRPPLQLSSEQSRAEQSRAEQSRAEQSRAEQSRAEQSRAELIYIHVYMYTCTV
jgi:hypothetical protein